MSWAEKVPKMIIVGVGVRGDKKNNMWDLDFLPGEKVPLKRSDQRKFSTQFDSYKNINFKS